MRRALAVLALAIGASGGCAPARPASVGAECELNSECSAPLVCRIGYCRNECATSADCPSGLSCVLDAQRLGVCQLAEEASCTSASECPAPLVCRFNQCTNECAADRDCLGGARCRLDPMGNACIDASGSPCAFDRECNVDGGEFCLAGRCRRQCFTDRDCRRRWRCNTTDFAGKCENPNIDAGRDTGPMDVGPVDARPGDAASDVASDVARDGGGSLCGGRPLDTGVLSVWTGRQHACAVVLDAGTQRVYCWGILPGDGLPTPCAREITALSPLGVVGVALGGSFTCVRLPGTGEVRCNGGLLAAGSAFEPLMPSLMTSTIAAGAGHACAADPTGIHCWGVNGDRQLGNGTRTSSAMPVLVTDVVSTISDGISLGRIHSCAILGGERRIECWGDDSFGQRGEGGGTLIIGATGVAAGGEHTCAIGGGVVYCWGQNSSGQLGVAVPMMRSTRDPVTLPPGTVVGVTAGNRHTCAVIDGNGFCWGGSEAIDGRTGERVPTPTMMFPGIRNLDAGDDFTCGVDLAGRVVCAGANDNGTLGDGTVAAHYVPAVVLTE